MTFTSTTKIPHPGITHVRGVYNTPLLTSPLFWPPAMRTRPPRNFFDNLYTLGNYNNSHVYCIVIGLHEIIHTYKKDCDLFLTHGGALMFIYSRQSKTV